MRNSLLLLLVTFVLTSSNAFAYYYQFNFWAQVGCTHADTKETWVFSTIDTADETRTLSVLGDGRTKEYTKNDCKSTLAGIECTKPFSVKLSCTSFVSQEKHYDSSQGENYYLTRFTDKDNNSDFLCVQYEDAGFVRLNSLDCDDYR